MLWITGGWILTAIVHIALALGVLTDSYRMLQHRHRGTFLVGGGMWALAVLLGGVVAAGIYWVIHHSTLRRDRPRNPDEPQAPEPGGENPR